MSSRRSFGTRAKLAVYCAILAASVAAAAGLAVAVDPIDTSDCSHNDHEDAADPDMGGVRPPCAGHLDRR